MSNIENMVMLDRYLTLIYESFVLVRKQIFILFVKKCNLGAENQYTDLKKNHLTVTIIIILNGLVHISIRT
jgi:hypothetical protein